MRAIDMTINPADAMSELWESVQRSISFQGLHLLPNRLHLPNKRFTDFIREEILCILNTLWQDLIRSLLTTKVYILHHYGMQGFPQARSQSRNTGWFHNLFFCMGY